MSASPRKRRYDDTGAALEALPAEERVRHELEARGLAPALAYPLAARIASRAADLSGDAYARFLDGVVAAQGAGDAPVPEVASPGTIEVQRLVQDFAAELKKLDEGLRLLSAYLLRIRDRAGRETPRIVH